MDRMNPAAEFSPEIMEKVARMEYRARMVVNGLMAGQHKSSSRGFNVEFLEHRQYYPGDDLKHVDWKVYARRDRFYVKQHEEEANLRAYILLDASGSMTYGDGGKLEYGRQLAAALAYLLIKQNDAVGLYVAGGSGSEVLEPMSSQAHLYRILGTMARAGAGGGAGLGVKLRDLGERMKRRGIAIVISDFLEDQGPVRESLKILRGRGNDISVFHVMDSNETGFPFTRASKFLDPETGVGITADPTAVKAVYLKALGNFIKGYRDFCARAGMDYTFAQTARSPEEVLLEYLQKRERSGRKRK